MTVGSLMDGRLFEQLAKMRNQYEQAVVLIEGDVYATQYGDIGEEAITGALTWLAGMSGCGVVTVPSPRYSAMAIRRLAIQQVWGLGYEIKLRTNKPKWEPDVGLYLVEGLPSVGPSTARILMSHFKSAEAVFRATEEELRSIKGVGPKTAEKLVSITLAGLLLGACDKTASPEKPSLAAAMEAEAKKKVEGKEIKPPLTPLVIETASPDQAVKSRWRVLDLREKNNTEKCNAELKASSTPPFVAYLPKGKKTFAQRICTKERFRKSKRRAKRALLCS
jgi:hypothetical protein